MGRARWALLTLALVLWCHWLAKPAGWAYQSASIKGRRYYQEDRVLAVPRSEGTAQNVAVFGIFDGHLGSRGSDYAATTFYPSFVHHLKNTTLENALRLAILDVEDGFMKLAAEQELEDGSTAVVAAVTSEGVKVANVGDSRALLCRRMVDGRVTVVALTSDHHPEVPGERARIESKGGFVVDTGRYFRVNGKLALSRAIGDRELKPYGVSAEPEITSWSTPKSGGVDQDGDDSCLLLLASDGVFEELSSEQVCRLVFDAKERKEKDVVARVLEQAVEAGSSDNLSMIIVDLKQ